MTPRSPTYRLLTGLLITLAAVGIYSAYTIVQLQSLRRLQTGTIDRNRLDSLLLLRIQNSLNGLALAMRDMLDTGATGPGAGATAERYPLTAWRPQFRRIRADLEDALTREEQVAVAETSPGQRRYLADSFRQFWASLDRVFEIAAAGKEDEARIQVRNSLQARQAALSTDVARMLVVNNQSEQSAALRTQELYAGVERNVYVFLAAMVVVIVLTSLYLVQYIRRLFSQVAELSDRRRELARQLITSQESTFRSISRELHDEFGQILTAIGAMLQRADRRASIPGPAKPNGAEPHAMPPPVATALPPNFLEDLREVREIVQGALEKVRSLSQALHPSVLDEAGLESALTVYLPGFEQRTGVPVFYEKTGASRGLDKEIAIHLYRVVQEALNNVVRHSKSSRAAVRLRFEDDAVIVEIEDNGIGYAKKASHGLGLVSMRERMDLIHGEVEFLQSKSGGALVRATAPYHATQTSEAHAGD
jgi:signal transduction histidine kinase